MANGQMNGWHLDKRVPITLIVMILLQTAGAFWWAAQIDTRVSALEQTALINLPRGERIRALEAELKGIRSSLERIEKKLDRR